MLAPITHILPLTTIRRERVLPVPGKVVVRAGQKVNATDVVAEASYTNPHLLLEVGRGLGLEADEADQKVQRKVGDQVTEGDVIAGTTGLLSRVVRAPASGRIVAIGGGQVLLELQSSPLELRAGISGTVTELVSDRGAIIETIGALIQGVWGNGRVDQGLLSVVAKSPDEELTAAQLDVGLRGSIVLAGTCTQADVLQMAAALPLRGLILASMTANLIQPANQLSFPIILLEGFGRLSMNPVAFNLLSTSDKREITANATRWDRFTGERPEVVIPLPATTPPPAPNSTTAFAPGQTVRILRAPLATKVGKLVAIRPGQTTFPSGIHAQAGIVRLENGDQAVIPLANLDVIE